MNRIKTTLIIFSLAFLTSIFFYGCSLYNSLKPSRPEVSIKEGFDGSGIAVLTFAKQGGGSSDLGKIAADNLSDAFFLFNKFNVIDRAKVNAAQAAIEIKSPDFLSVDQIQQVGLKIKAGYLVLGRIYHFSDTEYINSDAKKDVYISFRLVSVKDGEVAGIVNYMDSYTDENSIEVIKGMIRKITKEINNQLH